MSATNRVGRSGFWRSRDAAQLERRRLWDIGDWGNASDHIGDRWERLGFDALSRRSTRRDLPNRPGRSAAISLVHDAAIAEAIQSIGQTNPDALLVGLDGDEAGVCSVDLKWSIETASYRQISAEALELLVNHPDWPERSHFLSSAEIPATELTDDWLHRLHDGFFFAPDSRPNRAFIDSADNRRQEYPLDTGDVVLEPVSGIAFFSSLPWWPQAVLLAELDRADSGLDDVDNADKYYRLGSGLGGAIVRLNTPIFMDEAAELDIAAEVSRFLTSRTYRTSADVIAQLRGRVLDRAERSRILKDLCRSPYPYRQMVDDLAAAGVLVPAKSAGSAGAAERERWGSVHRSIAADHRARVMSEGLKLLGTGHSESSALAVLAGNRQEHAASAIRFAHGLLRVELRRDGSAS